MSGLTLLNHCSLPLGDMKRLLQIYKAKKMPTLHLCHMSEDPTV